MISIGRGISRSSLSRSCTSNRNVRIIRMKLERQSLLACCLPLNKVNTCRASSVLVTRRRRSSCSPSHIGDRERDDRRNPAQRHARQGPGRSQRSRPVPSGQVAGGFTQTTLPTTRETPDRRTQSSLPVRPIRLVTELAGNRGWPDDCDGLATGRKADWKKGGERTPKATTAVDTHYLVCKTLCAD